MHIEADIPIHQDICSTSDSGSPIVVSKPDSPQAVVYKDLAKKIWSKLPTEPPKWNRSSDIVFVLGGG